MEQLKVINIAWEKIPFNFDTIGSFNGKHDYGVYQIYGHHPAYVNDTLLYIGKAQIQTFGVHLTQESHHWHFVESVILH